MSGHKEEAPPFTVTGGKRLPPTAIQASIQVWWQGQREFLSKDWFALCGGQLLRMKGIEQGHTLDKRLKQLLGN